MSFTSSALTLAQLASDQALRLRVLVPGGDERLVRGTHVSDLEHPARYLLAGEIVLTNGLWLGKADCGAWVREVKSAGAAGIGFGLGGEHPETPEQLVEACRAQHVVLVEAPEDLSFSAIAERVRERNVPDENVARLQLLRLRRLLEELARGKGYGAIVELLRRETRLPVWLVGPGGRSLGQTGQPPREAREAARRALKGELPCTLGAQTAAFGVGDNTLSTTAVLVGAPLGAIDDEARLVIEQVAAYVAMEDARQLERLRAKTRLADELLRLAWTGDLGDAAYEARLRALELDPAQPITVLASSNEAKHVTYAVLGAHKRGIVYPASHRSLRMLLTQAEGSITELARELGDLMRDFGAEPVLGSSEPRRGATGVRQAMVEAVAAHQLASNQAGGGVVTGVGMSSHRLLLDFIDPKLLRGYRQAVLGGIEDWDREHRTELVHTVAAFLANDGHWRKTAAQLHIHTNTLRYRLDRVAAITGRSLDSTAARIDFALALAVDALVGGGPP